ncbi:MULTISPECIES: hypothetical protein [unclassified Frankia]
MHQFVVDACAAQHPGGTTRREVQAVALCLMPRCACSSRTVLTRRPVPCCANG